MVFAGSRSWGNDLIWENMSRLVIDADYLFLRDRVIKTGRTVVLGRSYFGV